MLVFRCIRKFIYFHKPTFKNMSTTTPPIKGPFNFISGERTFVIESFGDIPVIQPATGEILCTVQSSGHKEVDRAVKAAESSFALWSKMGNHQRGVLLKHAAQAIRERLEEIAQLEVLDTGKPIWEARADIACCADVWEYYGDLASSLGGLHQPLSDGNFAIIKREPIGVVAGIGAWNFPFQVMSWKAAPALICGNTFVYKPSEFTPLSSVILAEILSKTGIPPGVVNVIQGDGRTGEALCSHPSVDKVTFTGSVRSGKKVMKTCADGMKKITLELGGKSPLIVFADSDINESVKAALLGNFLTQGEVCSNCTRVFVERSIAENFVDALLKATNKLVIGNPFNDTTTVGAMITEDHGKKVLQYIESARNEGARVLCGGERIIPEDTSLSGGFYISPCILVDCEDSMTAVKEEIFGPVLSVLCFDTEEEAVKRANCTPYGLAAGIMSSNLRRAHRVADRLQAGIVWINNYNVFLPEVPFGGYKMSGFGRENGLACLENYSQLKSIYVEMNQIYCPIFV